MATKKAKNDLSNILDRVTTVVAKSFHDKAAATRPPGAFTAREYADRRGIPTATARNHIRMLIENGVLKQTRIYVPRGAGSVSSFAYIFVEEGEKHGNKDGNDRGAAGRVTRKQSRDIKGRARRGA